MKKMKYNLVADYKPEYKQLIIGKENPDNTIRIILLIKGEKAEKLNQMIEFGNVNMVPIDILNKDEEIKKLKNENADLKEKLKNYIPRRRVRRIFKSLRKVLEDNRQENIENSLLKLKSFILLIEQNGEQVAGKDIKQAIEYMLSTYNISEEE